MSVLNDEENLYLKTGNWNRRELDSRQLLYMAADVTLPGTVAFDTLICLVLEIGVDCLDKVYTDLEEFVKLGRTSQILKTGCGMKSCNTRNILSIHQKEACVLMWQP